MTLCIAWIRETEPNKELVFATDSCLSGGERWNNGIKLFDLPRRDALICFAGRTDRAYPLILNLVTSLRYNKEFQDNSKDITDLALYVAELFTELVLLITDSAESVDSLRSGAEFLFGGWSWKKRQFVLLKIYYDTREQKFIYQDCIDTTKTRKVFFLGDNIDDARALYHKEFERDRSDNLLNMEPLKVLAVMSRDIGEFTTISGALQIAKVYENGNTEFFGIIWPSIKGKPHFLGKEFNPFDKPEVRYIDPDTLVVYETPLPDRLQSISEAVFDQDTRFVEECYPAGRLKVNLNIRERNRLIDILRSTAYQQFLEENANDTIELDDQGESNISIAAAEQSLAQEEKEIEVPSINQSSPAVPTNVGTTTEQSDPTVKTEK